MLMEGDPFCLIEGMVIAGHAVGATTGYIYIRSEYPHAIKTMRKAIEVLQSHGLLGDSIDGSETRFDIHIRVGAGAYICGEESSMLESIEGKRGQVKVKPPIPAISGLFGKPTIVNNVLSLASVPCILDKGADYYKNFGVGRSRGTQPFQLAGDRIAQKPMGLKNFNSLAHGFDRMGVFRADIDVTGCRAHSVACNDHSFNQAKRIPLHQHPVGKGAAVSFVRITTNVFFIAPLFQRGFPFNPGGKTPPRRAPRKPD